MTNRNDTIIRDAQAAAGYDDQAQATNWLAPGVVFRLAREYVHPGERLLDLGIGSGLSSIPFHRAGLEIYGVDGSQEILRVCAAKGFASELVQWDLRDLPLPYLDHDFDAVIAVGVLNSFPDLSPYFAEAARLVKPEGILAFTTEDLFPGQATRYAINRTEVNEEPDPETAVWLYRHAEREIARLLEQNGFSLLTSEELVGFHYPTENRDVMFVAHIARRSDY